MAQKRYNFRDCLIAEHPQITVKRVLGNTKADILQKILYWTNHTKASKLTFAKDKFNIDRTWIYHSAKQFEAELQLDWTTIRDHLQEMEKDFVRYEERYNIKQAEVPYLNSGQFSKYMGLNTKFYSVDTEVLWDYISGWLPLKKPDWEQSLQNLEKALKDFQDKAKIEGFTENLSLLSEYRKIERKIERCKLLINRCKRVPTQEKIEEINTNLEMYHQFLKQKEMEDSEDQASENETSSNSYTSA